MTNYDELETRLRSRIRKTEPSPVFEMNLEAELENAWELGQQPVKRIGMPRLAWAGIALAFLLGLMLLGGGPNQVWAQIRSLMGFVPGVGVVDPNAPLRVLREPVKLTREGISLEVNSAMLSRDVTYLDYQFFGIPPEAITPDGHASGCEQEAYLRLPDGSRLERKDRAWPGIPAEVTEATLVVPCLQGTLPGSVPANWELPLSFINADQAPMVFPILELEEPTPEETGGGETSGQPWQFAVSTVIETPRGYILAGQGVPGNTSDRNLIMLPVRVTDAQGKEVQVHVPADYSKLLKTNAIPDRAWAIEFDSEGLAFPLTLNMPVRMDRFSVHEVEPLELHLNLKQELADGVQIELDQPFNLGEIQLRLVGIRGSRGGYSFEFEGPSNIIDLNLEIAGHQAEGAGAGGRGDSEAEMHRFTVTRTYAERPSVKLLQLRISGYTRKEAPEISTHTLTWEPQSAHAPYPQTARTSGNVCLNPGGLEEALQQPYAGAGWAFFLRNEGGNLGNLYRTNLSTNESTMVAANLAWPAVSPSGRVLAYPGVNGLTLLDLETQVPQLFPYSVSQIKWSPDGQQLALLAMQSGPYDYGLSLINTDGSAYTHLHNTGYASLAGWTPDGEGIIFLTASFNMNAWKVQRYNLKTQTVEELFTLNEGTIKYLDPEISPDGEWLAYRALDSSSVRLVRMDGSEDHLLIECLHGVELAWAWANRLAITLREPGSVESQTILVDILNCAVTALPEDLTGTIEAIQLP